jgi:5'-methylthioadenosine phosphorylase
MAAAAGLSGRNIAVILGSAFSTLELGGHPLARFDICTPFGTTTVYEWTEAAIIACLPEQRTRSFVVFRHGVPHAILPHKINYRAIIAALHQLDVGSIVITSSVGVMDPSIPLHAPLFLSDLLMPLNTLPDGSSCTMFVPPFPAELDAHLVIKDGLLSAPLQAEVLRCLEVTRSTESEEFNKALSASPPVIFAYVPGPRTKTAAENAFWVSLGAQVNSMTLAPEIVLANEMGMSTAAVVVGHKRSSSGPNRAGEMLGGIADSAVVADVDKPAVGLYDTTKVIEEIVIAFLTHGTAQPFGNQVFRFGKP